MTAPSTATTPDLSPTLNSTMRQAWPARLDCTRMEFMERFRGLVENKRRWEEELQAAKLFRGIGGLPAEIIEGHIVHTLTMLAEEFSDFLSCGSLAYTQDEAAFNEEFNRVHAAVFRAYGEFALAEMLEKGYGEFHRLLDYDKRHFQEEE